jgi:acetyltransferase
MPIKNLDCIFKPRSIAVIGASNAVGKVGNTVLDNILQSGYTNAVYPVNPNQDEIAGLKAYRTIQDLPDATDLAIICTPAATVPDLVTQCGNAGIRGLIILSAGFREMNKQGAELEEAIRQNAKQFDGLRIVGPNCLGVISPLNALNASFAGAMPQSGKVAFISQSGALCTAVLDWAAQEHIGFSHFVSLGNMLDVGIADLIDYFALDQTTDAIIMYVESIHEPRTFMSAARAFTRKKPIIAYKAGRFTESARAAASHTGAMAGVDAVYEAAFARAGIVRVFDMDDMFDCAELLARQPITCGPRLAIVTNAGGPGVMATDALLEKQGILANLSDSTINELNEHLPAAWSHANPIDVLGDATPERLAAGLRSVLADTQVDAALVLLTPQSMTDPTACAEAVVKIRENCHKPLLASWMGGVSMQPGINVLNEAGIPTYTTPEKAIRAFMHLVKYGRIRDTLYETPRELPIEFPLDRARVRAVFDTILSEGRGVLSESTSKALLEAYEIPISKTFVARSPEDAVEYSLRIGFPVALKVFSPEITHKTDVGGVELNLNTADEVKAAFTRITSRAQQKRPDAHIEGVTVQGMVVIPGSRELIVGAKRDPVFGTVLLVGAGGITAELFQDRAIELPPLNERLARRMLESLRQWPLLRGYRGQPGVDVDCLIHVLIRLSYLVADFPEIVELDVNPLLATPHSAIALDARIVLGHHEMVHPQQPYSHLAIRPYPVEFIKRIQLTDGQMITLRPIRPEDEPLWHALLSACSPETIHLRFHYLFKTSTHEMDVRFCFIDYDREMTIVAEIEEGNRRQLIGAASLTADVDHRDAEYAALVGDAWQGRGVGTVLTNYALEICRQWSIHQVTAEVARENFRMIRMLEHRGFAFDRSVSPDIVIAKKLTSAEL